LSSLEKILILNNKRVITIIIHITQAVWSKRENSTYKRKLFPEIQ